MIAMATVMAILMNGEYVGDVYHCGDGDDDVRARIVLVMMCLYFEVEL